MIDDRIRPSGSDASEGPDRGSDRCPFSSSAEARGDEECGAGAPRFRVATRPAPPEFPGLVGWIRAARSDALGLFPQRCFEEPRVDRRVALTRLSIVSDVETIRSIFAARAGDFDLCNLHLRMLQPSLGNGVIVAQGESWRRLRRASIGVIRRASNPAISGTPFEAAQAFARANAGTPDIAAPLSRLMLDLLATEILGHPNAISSPEITAAIERHRQTAERADLFDLLGVTPRLRSGKMRKAARIARDFDERIEAEIRQSPDSAPPQVEPGERRDLIVNLLTGFESLWLTSLWALLAIAHNPALDRWLRASGDERALRQRIERVALETLRLYPPLPQIYRKPTRDVTLASGVYRRGQLVCVSPYVVHRHALLWEDPEVFALDRPLSAYRDLPFMPFGLGARRCVGANVSLPLVSDVLAGLLSGHRPVSEAPMPLPRLGLSLRPGTPCALRLVAR